MMKISSLAAFNLGALQPYLPYIGIGVVAFILVIALIVGLSQGFRRVGWGGLLWGGACVCYALIGRFLAEKNQLAGIIQGMGVSAATASAVSAALVAVGCVLVFLIVFGLIAKIVRPYDEEETREEAAPQQTPYPPQYAYPPYGYPYQPYAASPYGEPFDEDFEEDEPERGVERRVKKSGADRFFGGIVAVINALVVLAMLGGLVLTVLNATALREGALKAVYELPVMQKIFPYVASYAIDFLLIGIVMLYVRRGYNVGIVAGLRSLVVSIGRIVAVGLAFWLPFSPYVAEGAPLAVIGKGNAAIAGMLSKYVPEALQGICAPVAGAAMGVILTVIFLIVVGIISWLLSLAIESTETEGGAQFFDGLLGAIVYVVIGLVVCIMICVALYAVQYFGLFEAGKLLGEQSALCKGIFNVCDEYVKPFLEKFTSTIGG